MPVVGIITKEGELLDKDAALKRATTFGNVDGFSLAALAQILSGYANKNPSASQIAGKAWRRTVLEALVDYYVYPEDCMAQLRGTLIHAGFQAVKLPWSVNVVAEKRYSFPLRTQQNAVISGQVDAYYPQHRRLEDYKTCQSIPKLIKPEHLLQLAVYFWLLRWAGQLVESAVINYVSWDEMAQVSDAEMPDGTVSAAVNHPYFTNEEKFTEEIGLGYSVIRRGLVDREVPSMQYCVRQWCRRCSVKWLCDCLPTESSRLPEEHLLQEECL